MSFLRLFLVFFSISFLWWLNTNMFLVPSLFLYVDFFVPLIYLILIFILSFLSLKFLTKEVTYKFLVDYLAKVSVQKVKNFKFLDLFLNKINLSGFSLFINFSFLSNSYLKSLHYNNLVILVFFIFILFWGFSLLKICVLHT